MENKDSGLLKDDELSEENLENVHAGLHTRELADDLAKQNAYLYRREMIDRLNEENENFEEEHTRSR